jgi:serine protease Do
MNRSLLIPMVGLAFAAFPAHAQEETPMDAPVADVPPVETLGFGETVSAFLSANDLMFEDSTYFKPYLFDGEAGDEITLHLSSADFDAFLLLADSSETPFLSDDNSGGACNAYLTATLPAAGQYLVFVNTTRAGDVGQFQLTLQQGTQPAESRDRCQGFITFEGRTWVGGAVEGELGAGNGTMGGAFFEAWLLPDVQGQPFTVDLISDDFDAGLVLVQGFAEVLDVNDDGAGACNARIAHTPASARPFRVVVRTAGEGQSGSYLLRVKPGLETLVDQPPCDRGGPGGP